MNNDLNNMDSNEARKAAKALQKKLQMVTDAEERKRLARKMNELFTEAKKLKNKAKQRYRFEESIEREFNSLQANLEDN